MLFQKMVEIRARQVAERSGCILTTARKKRIFVSFVFIFCTFLLYLLVSGVARGWTRVDVFFQLSQESVPEIDTNPMSLQG